MSHVDRLYWEARSNYKNIHIVGAAISLTVPVRAARKCATWSSAKSISVALSPVDLHSSCVLSAILVDDVVCHFPANQQQVLEDLHVVTGPAHMSVLPPLASAKPCGRSDA